MRLDFEPMVDWVAIRKRPVGFIVVQIYSVLGRGGENGGLERMDGRRYQSSKKK